MILEINNKLYKKTAGIKIRRAIFLLLVVILVQAVLGTAVRMYIDDISKTLSYNQREAWLADLPLGFIIHRSFSWFVLLAVLYTAWYCRKVLVLKKYLLRLVVIIFTSMTTGIVLYYLDMPAMAQPLHLLLAALAITQTMFILLYTKNTTDLLKPQIL